MQREKFHHKILCQKNRAKTMKIMFHFFTWRKQQRDLHASKAEMHLRKYATLLCDEQFVDGSNLEIIALLSNSVWKALSRIVCVYVCVHRRTKDNWSGIQIFVKQ